MAASDATPIPVKNQAYRVTFPIFDADGDLVTGATGLDSEVSKDAGTFADCTNEATEIATSSGVYYLDLTATEMNADTVAVIVKTSSSGAKTTTLVMYPRDTGVDYAVNVTHWNGTALATTNPLPNAAAGASGGLLISGSNSGTTTLAALTVTGALTVSDGVIITASTTNRPGFQSTGNGIGPGMTLKSGSGGATGAGLSIQSQATNGSGIQAVGAGTGAGMYLLGGEYGLRTAGTVLGVGIASDGEGMQISAANGNGVNVIAAGTDKHGILVTGGSAGTSDGVKLVAGTGGTDLRANVTGNLSGSIGSLGATAKSDVNTEVLDVLNTDTFAEPGQENPPATTTLIKKIGYLYKAWRNKSTQTSTEYKLYADDTTTVDQKATASDDGTTFTRGEAATGP